MISAIDIGIADPNGIVVVQSCWMLTLVLVRQKVFFVSFNILNIIQSNSTKSIFKAIEKIKAKTLSSVPNHLRNNSGLYKNPHNYPENWVQQEYLPAIFKGLKIWQPKNNGSGWENKRYEELLKIKKR